MNIPSLRYKEGTTDSLKSLVTLLARRNEVGIECLAGLAAEALVDR